MTLFRFIVALACLFVIAPTRAAHAVYNADLGRWMQRDPAGFVDGPNPSLFVRGNPSRWHDSHGLLALPVDIRGTQGTAMNCGGFKCVANIVVDLDSHLTPLWMVARIEAAGACFCCDCSSIFDAEFYELWAWSDKQGQPIPFEPPPGLPGGWAPKPHTFTHPSRRGTDGFAAMKAEIRVFSQLDTEAVRTEFPSNTGAQVASGDCCGAPIVIETNRTRDIEPWFWDDRAHLVEILKIGAFSIWRCCEEDTSYAQCTASRPSLIRPLPTW
jgi:hypothetical protein